MRNIYYITTAFILNLLIIVGASANAIYIFGGEDYDTFLGCINCDKYSEYSIWNSYGDYGSKYETNSIWNKYGDFGSEYSSTSPFNRYADNPPMLVDDEGGFYGYLTRNKYNNPSKWGLVKYIVTNYKTIRDNTSETYELIFE